MLKTVVISSIYANSTSFQLSEKTASQIWSFRFLDNIKYCHRAIGFVTVRLLHTAWATNLMIEYYEHFATTHTSRADSLR